MANVKKADVSFWEEIGAFNWVLKIWREGYALPFISESEPKIFRNNSSALKNKDFVTQEILDPLNSGQVCKVSTSDMDVISSLTVADNGSKQAILDCSYNNFSEYSQD